MKRLNPWILLVSGALLLPAVLGAVQTRQEVHAGFSAFLKGTFENLSLDDRGTFRPAPGSELIGEIDGPIIWDAIEGEGETFFMGTGNSGIVVAVNAEGSVEEIFNPEELLTRGLAFGPDKALYVATSPNGRVYRLERTDSGAWKNAEIYFDPPETYLWDLQFNEDGDLFVATGQGARIYRLPSGFKSGEDEAEVYFKSSETHFSTMEFDREGNLLVGSGPNGYVYRVTGPEEGFALHHADVPEIRSILPMPDGSIYFATFNSSSGSTGDASSGGEGSDKDGGDGSSGTGPDPWVVSAFTSAGSRIMKIDPEGFVELFWELPDIQVYDIAPDGVGGLYIGTGGNGRIFQASSRTDWTLLDQLPSGGDVSTLLTRTHGGTERLYAFSSNPARIYQMASGSRGKSEFTSTTIDGKQVVSWGRFDARNAMGNPVKANLFVETRSGNTPRPDATWSPYKPLDEGALVASPNARYLQYRITWPETAGTADSLRAVRVYYRMQNLEPSIRRINVVPLGLELVSANNPRRNFDLSKLTDSGDPRAFISASEPRQQLVLVREEAALTAGWNATDPNGDRLRFRVDMQGPESPEWVTLADDLSDPVFSMNLNGLDEGYYQLRVTASDHLDNVPGEERTFSLVSDPVLVDLTPPVIRIEKDKAEVGEARIQIEVTDTIGTVTRAEYRLDGGPARRVLPVDGLHDQRSEQFHVHLQDLEPGSHSLVFEAYDENGNIGNRQIVFTVK